MKQHSVYGSDVYKQVYIYGLPENDLTSMSCRTFGFSWGICDFLLTNFMQKAGLAKIIEMRTRIAKEITSTLASNCTREVTLQEALSLQGSTCRLQPTSNR